jgi:hypothetical protein
MPNETDRELKENRRYEVNVCCGIDIYIERKNIKVKAANAVDINLEAWRVWGVEKWLEGILTRGKNISMFWVVVRLVLVPRRRKVATQVVQ